MRNRRKSTGIKNRTHEDFVTNWMGTIKQAERYRDKKYSKTKVKEYYKMYRGDWKDDVIPVNRIFSHGRSLIPGVYFRSPRVTVTELKPEFKFHARVVEAVDNYMIRETDLKSTLKSAALLSYLGGTGGIKLGYDSEFGFTPEQSVLPDSQTLTQRGRNEDRRIEYRTNVKAGMPWALPCDAQDIIIPIGYKTANELPWIGHRILRPLEDVMQDQKYKNTKELQGTRSADITKVQSQIGKGFEDYKFAELYEVRDKRTKEVYVFCENELLLSAPDALQIEGLPWEFLIFNEDPEYFWGISDVKMVEKQQIELNEIRTQTRGHRGISLIKFLYLKGALSKKALSALLSGNIGPGVEIDGESIGQAVQMMQPHIPPDLSVEAQNVRYDIRETLGRGPNQSGDFNQMQNTSAAETLEVARGSDVRDNERKDIVADTLVRIVRKWNQYMFKFWTDKERVVRIAGPEGAEWWVSYTGEQLEGEYTHNVDPDSGFPVSKALRMQASEGLLKQYGGDPLIDQLQLRSQHLQQLEWLFPGVSSILKSPMQPEQADAMAGERQPGPAFGGGSGRPPGAGVGTKDNPMQFEQAKQKWEESK